MPVAGLGLGANVGRPARQLRDAVRAIARDVGQVLRESSLWRTPAWGLTEQPPFTNACILVETALTPPDLLASLKRIERAAGREPGLRWGPRPLDLDILFYDDVVLDIAGLTIPHKSMFDRAFVLAPLAEIAGARMVGGRRIDAALARLDVCGLEKIATPHWAADGSETGQMGEWIRLRANDGIELSAWRASPAGTPKGGIVVLQEIFGVNHHIRAVADSYAQAGYLAVAPALFDRVEPGVELGYDGADMARAMEIRGRATPADTLLDIGAAVAAVAHAGPVGIVGYCWGGSLAWASAARIEGVAAAVGYYGGTVAKMLDLAPRAPVMLHFGAKDAHIPLSDVETIRSAHPAVPVFVYDADHGFNCDERASYDAAAAGVARERTMAFFAQHLQSTEARSVR